LEIAAFGKYLLLKKLAVGGMAEIFLAKQTGLVGFEKLLVIKRILPEMAAEAEFVQMFLDEARLAASLAHPNVVQIYDLDRVGNAYYIAMEYIAGQDLHGVIMAGRSKKMPLPAPMAARMIAGACDGLHYAHTLKDLRGNPLGLVHRDVTPSNILISWDGVSKVVDFGIAKAATQVTKTRAGALKGKFSYMGPEQVRSGALDGRADVWALGVVLHEILTQKKLFKADNELAILTQILQGEIPPPSSVQPDVPKALDEIVLKALERDIGKRYASARHMQTDLDAWLRTIESPVTTVQVGEYLQVLFAEEFEANKKLLAEIPTATAEKLAELLGSGGGTEDGLSFDEASNPSFTSKPKTKTKTKPGAPADEEPLPPPVAPPSRSPMRVGIALGVAAIGTIAFLALKPAPPPPPFVPTSGEVQVKSDPPGASIYLDGFVQDARTPTVLKDLSLGRAHEIRLELDGRQNRSQTVELTEKLPLAAVALTLPPVESQPGSLVISTQPPGANVFLDGAKRPTPSPVTIPDVASGVPHAIMAEKDGFELATQQVTVDPGAKKEITLLLKPRTAGSSPVAAVVKAQPTNPGGATIKALPPPPVIKSAATGTLSLTTTPPIEVFSGDRSLGTTPIGDVALPAGDVLLRLVNKEVGMTFIAKVVIKEGQKTEKSIALQKGKLAADVQPWADVYIGDKKLGTTPLAPREVYEGTYMVRLVNSEIGALKTVDVVVKAGQTTVVRQDLSQQ
jgi:serine/threonine-protein kinase